MNLIHSFRATILQRPLEYCTLTPEEDELIGSLFFSENEADEEEEEVGVGEYLGLE